MIDLQDTALIDEFDRLAKHPPLFGHTPDCELSQPFFGAACSCGWISREDELLRGIERLIELAKRAVTAETDLAAARDRITVLDCERRADRQDSLLIHELTKDNERLRAELAELKQQRSGT